MVYVYRRAPSQSARELAEALDGRRARGRIPIATRVRQGDFIVCWGETHPQVPGTRILNNATIRSKFEDAQLLHRAGVQTVEVSGTAPRPTVAPTPADPAEALFNEAVEMAGDFAELNRPERTQPFRAGLNELIAKLGQLNTTLIAPAPVAQPVAPVGEWLPRLNDHVGGEDLLHPPDEADFYVKKLNLINEFRVHSFLGKSIRAGIKAPREGVANPHPWIRSYDGGWRIRYDGVSSKKAHRELAHAAVKALGLDFGAVDIGETADHRLVVLEVNRAPGLEGGTIEVYANAIRGWMTGA